MSYNHGDRITRVDLVTESAAQTAVNRYEDAIDNLSNSTVERVSDALAVKIFGFAGLLGNVIINLVEQNRIENDFTAQKAVYEDVLSHYGNGNIGVEVSQQLEYFDTYYGGFQEKGWLPVGTPFITGIQLPDGTWIQAS
ncbi:MAG: hypothetical protein ACQESJ_07520 [Bacteroidota bacterium]